MKIEAHIDGLIKSLDQLKPLLSENSFDNREKFQGILMSTIDRVSQTETNSDQTKINKIPSWVDTDYGYNPENPRKPNVRELTEALARTTIEDLHENSKSDYYKFTKLAGELLYNTASTVPIDSRDWQSIMESTDILSTAREETGNMLSPSVQIHSEFDHMNTLLAQRAVLEDKTGNTLRYLDDMTEDISDILQNYGVKRGTLSEEVIEEIDPILVSEKVLNELVSFNEIDERYSLEVSRDPVIEASIGAIKQKYHSGIPLEEYEKL